MNTVDKALETQLSNIQTRTGKTLDELYAVLSTSGLTKHGELRDLLKRDLGLGHGDANTLVHFFLKATSQSGTPTGTTTDDAISAIYAGAKGDLRPIHDRLMAAIS